MIVFHYIKGAMMGLGIAVLVGLLIGTPHSEDWHPLMYVFTAFCMAWGLWFAKGHRP